MTEYDVFQTFFWFVSIIFMLLQVADMVSTSRVLRLGGREANPFMALLMKKSVPLAYFVKMFVAVLVVVIIHVGMESLWGMIFMSAYCVPYIWVVIHNHSVEAELIKKRNSDG